MEYKNKMDALTAKAGRVIEENWRETWRLRQKLFRTDSEKQVQAWIDKHQKDYAEPIQMDWHPKDDFVAYLPPKNY